MYALSDGLYAALRTGSPTHLIRLTVRWPDGTVRQVFDLAQSIVLGGSVRAELRRDARRSASLDIDNTDGVLAPAISTDMLAEGSSVRIESGAFVDGEPVMMPLITGLVGPGTSASMRGAKVSVAVESHLSACRQEAGEAVQLAQGTSLADALHTLWDPVLPSVIWRVDNTAAERVLGAEVPVFPGDYRLDMGLRLARDLGCEAFDDREGAIVVQVRPDPSAQATARVMSEPIDLTRTIVRPPVNAQPVSATPGIGDEIWVVEEVTDPGSPIHRDRIGLRMAPVIRSDAIADVTTARATARAWLAGRSLAADRIDATEHAAHLDLDPGDILERDETITRTTGRFVLESITVPLGPGTISTTETAVVPLFLTEAE
jgi:hypothetical protein